MWRGSPRTRKCSSTCRWACACRCTARQRGGRCCRAWTPAARELLHRCERVAYTPATITDLDALMAEVDFARRHGYARSNGEFYPGDITISAAVTDAGGTPVGAVNVSVPSSRWSFEQAQAVFGPQVMETAHAISASRTLGRGYPFYELEPPGGVLRYK
nr:IclR family transcriptional regulator C-terminal domain-containing protein [Achromobacter sp. DMS1]